MKLYSRFATLFIFSIFSNIAFSGSLIPANDYNETEFQKQLLDDVTNRFARPNLAQGLETSKQNRDVCPFMRKTIQKNLLHFMEINNEETDVEKIEQVILDLKETFLRLNETAESKLNKTHNTIILAFPNLPEDLADNFHKSVLIPIQRKMKPLFTEEGLMIGDFGPNHEETGLHSRNFRPFESRFSFIAIRNMHPADLVFMHQSKDGENQAKCLDNFISNFESKGKMSTRLSQQCKQAKSELQQDSASSPLLKPYPLFTCSALAVVTGFIYYNCSN